MSTERNADKVGGPSQGQRSRGPPPALNPESAALVQPYKDFIQKGFITTLVVEFTPMGVGVRCRIRADLRKNGEDANTDIAIGDAKNRIIEKNLWTPGNKGSKAPAKDSNVAPKKSLRLEDFSLTDSQLVARAKAVAAALGDSTARGRIGSLNLMVEGVDKFEDWWKSAAPSEKTRLLSDKKHHDTFAEKDHFRLNGLLSVCPFRGPVPSTPEEEEKEANPKLPTPLSNALVQKKKGGK